MFDNLKNFIKKRNHKGNRKTNRKIVMSVGEQLKVRVKLKVASTQYLKITLDLIKKELKSRGE